MRHLVLGISLLVIAVLGLDSLPGMIFYASVFAIMGGGGLLFFVSNVKKERTMVSNGIETKMDADKSLDAFLNRVPHDFNAPISSLAGLIEMGRNVTQDPDALQVFDLQEKVLNKTQLLLRDVMEVGAIRSHILQVRKSCIRDLISDTLDFCLTAEQATKITVNAEVESCEWNMDFYLTRLALVSAIHNASQHIREGNSEIGPEIKISTHSDKYKNTIRITDNGYGIPVTVQPQIFDMFTIGNNRVQGSGLGLYKARLAMQKQSGEIRLVSSEPGHTSFSIELKG